MAKSWRRAVLGVGSAHGDDCIGWRVVDALCERGLPDVYLGKISSPIDIVDHLAQSDELHIVDAAADLGDDQLVGRFTYATEPEQFAACSLASHSTHGIGLGDALRLADSLGLRVDHVSIWCARGESFEPLRPLSPTALRSIEQCTAAIVQQLRAAEKIAG